MLPLDSYCLESLKDYSCFLKYEEISTVQIMAVNDVKAVLSLLLKFKRLNKVEINCDSFDLDHVIQLKNLKELKFKRGVKDAKNINKIGVLTNTKILDLKDLKLGNIDFLKGMFNLERLNITAVKLHDLSPLEHLKNLKKLKIDFMMEEFDISNLGFLTQIEELTIVNSTLNSLDPLKSLANLKKLRLSYNQNIREISSVSHFTALESLELCNNGLTSISSIKHLTRLTNLKLENKEGIKDISERT